ncbi:hypothetical protein AK812_SmicGene21360 [Symbiodinium microadriaticum]|uniref:Uncharacterized protein n=1 Tax=Symbiodinium microadriaticum TaxID=2951 RepID=A0A1Q9DMH1_SYMMI|nr:hypothetical protein AK812_SmicGene21360 [Symbiodinium microadriaticum]
MGSGQREQSQNVLCACAGAAAAAAAAGAAEYVLASRTGENRSGEKRGHILSAEADGGYFSVSVRLMHRLSVSEAGTLEEKASQQQVLRQQLAPEALVNEQVAEDFAIKWNMPRPGVVQRIQASGLTVLEKSKLEKNCDLVVFRRSNCSCSDAGCPGLVPIQSARMTSQPFVLMDGGSRQAASVL